MARSPRELEMVHEALRFVLMASLRGELDDDPLPVPIKAAALGLLRSLCWVLQHDGQMDAIVDRLMEVAGELSARGLDPDALGAALAAEGPTGAGAPEVLVGSGTHGVALGGELARGKGPKHLALDAALARVRAGLGPAPGA